MIAEATPFILFLVFAIAAAAVLEKYNRKKYLIFATLSWFCLAFYLDYQMGSFGGPGIENIVILLIATALPVWVCYFTILVLHKKEIPFYVTSPIGFLAGSLFSITVPTMAFFAAVFLSVLKGDI